MLRYLTAAALAAFLLPSVALAQVPPGAVCGERSKFLTHLGHNFKEVPTAMGVTASGRVLEVLTSESGTWTIIMTHPSGFTCMVTAGQAWQNLERVAAGPAT